MMTKNNFKNIVCISKALSDSNRTSKFGGNGELGFYLISDGGRTPFRLHFRRPSFIYYQAYPEMVTGGMLSDAIVVMSSLNLIAGELDA